MEKQTARTQFGGAEEIRELNKKPGDKIPTKIKEKHAARTKGGEAEEMREENKKPGDKIPNKIKEKQAAKTQGGDEKISKRMSDTALNGKKGICVLR